MLDGQAFDCLEANRVGALAALCLQKRLLGADRYGVGGSADLEYDLGDAYTVAALNRDTLHHGGFEGRCGDFDAVRVGLDVRDHVVAAVIGLDGGTLRIL